MKKPCRLELNNSGSWKLVGVFDAANDGQSALVMEAADLLMKALHVGTVRLAGRMRICTDEALPAVLTRWDPAAACWVDDRTGRRL